MSSIILISESDFTSDMIAYITEDNLLKPSLTTVKKNNKKKSVSFKEQVLEQEQEEDFEEDHLEKDIDTEDDLATEEGVDEESDEDDDEFNEILCEDELYRMKNLN